MEIKTDNYVCSICGKRNVKLWRPHTNTAPLICAECAEKQQTPRSYPEITICFFKKEGRLSYEEFTGKIISLPEWEVNEEGEIPQDIVPSPERTKSIPMPNQLQVNISDVSKFKVNYHIRRNIYGRKSSKTIYNVETF